jgi:hypothetical protein
MVTRGWETEQAGASSRRIRVSEIVKSHFKPDSTYHIFKS